jgi:prolipoprotein diacylglyceryltransferase
MRRKKQAGTVFTVYLVLCSAAMFVLECFREAPYCIWGTEIPVNFVVSGVILLTILIGWGRQFSLNKKLKKIHFIGN